MHSGTESKGSSSKSRVNERIGISQMLRRMSMQESTEQITNSLMHAFANRVSLRIADGNRMGFNAPESK